jgi:hypothetical protein
MFDSVESLRKMAHSYRKAVDSLQDEDVARFFNALAGRCDRQAAALESKQQERGTCLVAWDSFHSATSLPLIDQRQ